MIDATRSGSQNVVTASSHGPIAEIPKGLSRTGWFSSGPGRRAAYTTPVTMTPPASTATGRHLGDGNRPSGKYNRPKVMSGEKPQIQIHDETQPAAKAPGSDPGSSTNPRWA